MKSYFSLSAIGLALVLAGCTTVGPDYVKPETQNITPSEIHSDSDAVVDTQEPAQTWWKQFKDPVLDGLVEQALVENKTLAQAIANVNAARARLQLEEVNLRPTGEVTASSQRRQVAGAGFGQSGPLVPDSDLNDITLTAGWELDFVGRVQRLTEAAAADLKMRRALYQDAQVLVVSETALAYIQYVGSDAQIRVAKRNLDVQQQTLDIIESRIEGGMGDKLDAARANAQLNVTRATLPPLFAQRTAAQNRLATLTGQTVAQLQSQLAKSNGTLPVPPEAITIGSPASLLLRRPDVRAAEQQLAAATARIGVAKADYFPRISLVGSASLTALSSSGLDNSGAFGYSVGPQLQWNGFDVPRVRAQVNAAGANAAGALAAYEEAVLLAFEETQTSLTNYGREKARFEALQEATRQANLAVDIAQVRFDEGVDDFINVLDAQTRLLEAEAALEISRVSVSANVARVYRTLGAGSTVGML